MGSSSLFLLLLVPIEIWIINGIVVQGKWVSLSCCSPREKDPFSFRNNSKSFPPHSLLFSFLTHCYPSPSTAICFQCKLPRSRSSHSTAGRSFARNGTIKCTHHPWNAFGTLRPFVGLRSEPERRWFNFESRHERHPSSPLETTR